MQKSCYIGVASRVMREVMVGGQVDSLELLPHPGKRETQENSTVGTAAISAARNS